LLLVLLREAEAVAQTIAAAAPGGVGITIAIRKGRK